MANSLDTLQKWREYFRKANSDIFDIIEYAIIVASSDCPYDFKTKRDRIAEMLFTCKVTKCFGCDRIGLAVPCSENDGKSDEKCKSGIETGGSKDTKESKNSCRHGDEDDCDDADDHREVMEMNVNQVGNFSYGEAEALSDEIEEENQLLGEVLRIKEILDSREQESDKLLLDSLRRLQLMPLSVEILKATEVGKSVSALRHHGSKDIRSLARTLVGDWTNMLDAWVKAATASAGAEVITESVRTSAAEEEVGLPSPPLDEGAFFANPTSMELSQFFDGIDDDGNPQNAGELKKKREIERKPTVEKQNVPKQKDQIPDHSTTPAVLKKQPAQGRPIKPPADESGPRRPKPNVIQRSNKEVKTQEIPDKGTLKKKPMPAQKDKLRSNDEASVQAKLAAAKRKLQERYQEAENAKKQRTIQVVEFHDLPKQNSAQKNQQMRPGNHNWHRATGRR